MEEFVQEQEQEVAERVNNDHRVYKCLEELIRKIELILIEEGQHDKRFKLGDFIKYTPYEVAEIMRKHSDELQT